MKVKIAVINGSNMNILGKREPRIYGKENWDDIERKLKNQGKQIDAELLFFQSNYEGEIVDFIQKNIDELSGVVINPAAFTKVGYSILDALNAVKIPYVEVHLTNIVSRGGWHAESIFTGDAIGLIIGFKGLVYELGVLAICNFVRGEKNE